jgi:voltage-gated potassium channel
MAGGAKDSSDMSALNETRRNLRISIAVLVFFAMVSTVGFWILGEERTLLDSLYLTANIFSTVGAWRDSFDDADRLWEILMIVFGIGAAVYAFGNVMALVTGGEVQRMLGRRQLTGKMRSLEGHYIVSGFGRMGQGVARSLAREGAAFVVIDRSREMTTAADDMNYLYLLGDAADESILRMAGIDRARGLVTCLPHDADNVFATLTARELNPKLTIIARAEQEQTERRLISAGADRVISPPVIGAVKVTRMLLHPAVDEFLDAAAAQNVGLDRITVTKASGLAGKSLRDLGLPRSHGLMVLAIESRQGQREFNPSADHILREDEQVIVMGPREAVDRLAGTRPVRED